MSRKSLAFEGAALQRRRYARIFSLRAPLGAALALLLLMAPAFSQAKKPAKNATAQPAARPALNPLPPEGFTAIQPNSDRGGVGKEVMDIAASVSPSGSKEVWDPSPLRRGDVQVYMF